jgi:hypothetical protein
MQKCLQEIQLSTNKCKCLLRQHSSDNCTSNQQLIHQNPFKPHKVKIKLQSFPLKVERYSAIKEKAAELTHLHYVPVGRDFCQALGDLGASTSQKHRQFGRGPCVKSVEKGVHPDSRVALEHDFEQSAEAH